MIDLWISAALLLLAALGFLLLPLLRGRTAQAEEDRTALNVALYEERVAELRGQHANGALSAEQLAQAQTEAGRELLQDTEAAPSRHLRLGRGVPLLASLLVPVVAAGLYLQWGGSDKLELAREFAEQPRSVEQLIDRLERAVQAQPDAAESWYVLGRAYMTAERPGDAAPAFEQAIGLAGRSPDLLSQWAQALYFANDREWTEQMQALTDEALQAQPDEPTSLGLRGIAAFEAQQYAQAVAYWQRLVAQLAPADPSRAAIQAGIDRAQSQLGEAAPATNEAASAGWQVSVRLTPEVEASARPDDAVFVFARAAEGPPMPLAVKRMRVGDLPATVSLSDADAMLPQLRLSNFDQVRLFARISRAGDATSGEWLGELGPLPKTAMGDPVELIIDQPDPR